ncbi:MAG: hypothetical protein IID28_11625 [Planctomycetes bacterium]|nr:hypothetical protein [Planctomycetota bacterium]
MDDRTGTIAASRRTRLTLRRRGVSSVLAMMFLVIFSSLAAAMAVVAQGNLRTADSYMKVSRAMSAAETGLVFASRRLRSESSRFVVTKGVIDEDYGAAMWDGTYPADGSVVVLTPSGYTEASPPAGVAEAILHAHWADIHTITPEPGDSSLPTIDELGTLRARPIALVANADGSPNENGPYFRLKYQIVSVPDDAGYVLVTSRGYDQNITRTLQMMFRIDKKIEYALISPSRIMIGKNVRVEGPLGSVYGTESGELDTENGDPLVMRSDFYFLNDALTNNLDTFFAQVALHDADGDGRIRIYHPTEQLAIAAAPGIIVDTDQNEYVDDFDLFMAHYDADNNQAIVYDSFLAGGLPVEFDVDLQLARLIDEANPDRDGIDGPSTPDDIALGWRDGVLDIMDTYAKIRGRLSFAVSFEEWEVANDGTYQTVVQGTIAANLGEAPVTFGATNEELRELTTEMFENAATWYESRVPPGAPATPADFAQVGVGGTFEPGDLGNNWESIPFGAQGAYDFYDRPIYRDMTFTNVRIPMGNNGLYDNCVFIGVTFIETEPQCIDVNWNYAGALEKIETFPGSGIFTYEPKYPGVEADLNGTPVPDTKILSNNIRFHGCTFIGTIAGVKPTEYTHWRNKVQLTGQTRFYIYSDDPDLDGQPDEDVIRAVIDSMAITVLEELRKSSILLPGWSADIGSFTNDQAADPMNTPKVKLKGTIVAGILDIRGTADIFGTLITTFRPVTGEGPLFYGGLTDAFNTTIGYFGPADGDGEGTDDVTGGFGEITLRYDPDALLPDGIPWPIRIDPEPMTYTEGGSI